MITKSPDNAWLSVGEARGRILSHVAPVADVVSAPLDSALLAVLAEDVVAPFDVPGFDNSAMDGFACRINDVSGAEAVTLPVVGAAFAGHPFEGEVKEGECVKIMTGARLPAGADVIVPQEETEYVALAHNGDDSAGGAGDGGDGAAARVLPNPKRRAGLHIRLAGEDLKRGAVALPAGALCLPAQLGLAASLGLTELRVMRKLRVAFFSTGDEVRSAGEALGGGDVYDSNRHTLRAMIQRMGFEALDFGVVKDDRAQLADVMDRAAAGADVIITSGGASVGEADFIREVLAARGEVLFWKIAMRPGRPLAYGKVGGADFFGLPGNPVSVMVCFYQFAREALWRRAGRRGDITPPTMRAVTTSDLRHAPGRMEFQRGRLAQLPDGGYAVTVTGDQGSGILSSMTAGNCFIVLPADCPPVKKGDVVDVQPFEGLV